jgi:hypothetical protein
MHSPPGHDAAGGRHGTLRLASGVERLHLPGLALGPNAVRVGPPTVGQRRRIRSATTSRRRGGLGRGVRRSIIGPTRRRSAQVGLGTRVRGQKIRLFSRIRILHQVSDIEPQEHALRLRASQQANRASLASTAPASSGQELPGLARVERWRELLVYPEGRRGVTSVRSVRMTP